uniref:Uncharacterized protein n=1 Tax=Anopheles coluzzii TaxID=1518534 RepID=A0A8W7P008_ANOCL
MQIVALLPQHLALLQLVRRVALLGRIDQFLLQVAIEAGKVELHHRGQVAYGFGEHYRPTVARIGKLPPIGYVPLDGAGPKNLSVVGGHIGSRYEPCTILRSKSKNCSELQPSSTLVMRPSDPPGSFTPGAAPPDAPPPAPPEAPPPSLVPPPSTGSRTHPYSTTTSRASRGNVHTGLRNMIHELNLVRALHHVRLTNVPRAVIDLHAQVVLVVPPVQRGPVQTRHVHHHRLRDVTDRDRVRIVLRHVHAKVHPERLRVNLQQALDGVPHLVAPVADLLGDRARPQLHLRIVPALRHDRQTAVAVRFVTHHTVPVAVHRLALIAASPQILDRLCNLERIERAEQIADRLHRLYHPGAGQYGAARWAIVRRRLQLVDFRLERLEQYHQIVVPDRVRRFLRQQMLQPHVRVAPIVLGGTGDHPHCARRFRHKAQLHVVLELDAVVHALELVEARAHAQDFLYADRFQRVIAHRVTYLALERTLLAITTFSYSLYGVARRSTPLAGASFRCMIS